MTLKVKNISSGSRFSMGYDNSPRHRKNAHFISQKKQKLDVTLQTVNLCCSVAKLCLTLCNPMDCSIPGSLVLHYLLEFAQIYAPWVGDTINQLIFHHPLLLLPPIFPSIRVFSNELTLHTRWPKYWSFSFSISPSNEYSGLISFRIDWFDLLAAQGTLKSLLQSHNSQTSILWCSAFFMV